MTIAGSRLDIQMGLLGHHLDRTRPFETTRWQPGKKQSEKVRRLVFERLHGEMKQQALVAVDLADDARQRRNDVVHQDWLLRGRDATRPVDEIARIAAEDRAAYLEEWERESKDSDDWLRVPRRSIEVSSAQPLSNLREVERALADATSAVQVLTYSVASSRECGKPPGYVHPG